MLESSLKQGTTWRLVGAAGQPAFGDNESCDWSNYDSVHSSTAFTRDAAGFVHLKGTLKTRQGPGVCDDVTERAVFVLPPGYRPQKRESMPAVGDGPTSPHIDGPALAGPAGGVSPRIHHQRRLASIDGISFRCAPAGVNGVRRPDGGRRAGHVLLAATCLARSMRDRLRGGNGPANIVGADRGRRLSG